MGNGCIYCIERNSQSIGDIQMKNMRKILMCGAAAFMLVAPMAPAYSQSLSDGAKVLDTVSIRKTSCEGTLVKNRGWMTDGMPPDDISGTCQLSQADREAVLKVCGYGPCEVTGVVIDCPVECLKFIHVTSIRRIAEPVAPRAPARKSRRAASIHTFCERAAAYQVAGEPGMAECASQKVMSADCIAVAKASMTKHIHECEWVQRQLNR
jgi:hypothetical protein